MRRKYRGFRGQVAPLAPSLAGLGWLERSSWDTNLDTERFPGAKSFCGTADYAAYVAEHGAPPAGSAIYGTSMGMPEFCREAGYGQEYVYTTGGNITQTRVTGPAGADVTALVTAPTEPLPPAATEPISARPVAPFIPEWRQREMDEAAARLRAQEQELETRQAAEGGDGTVPELEARASVQEAQRRAIDIGGGPGPGAPAPIAPVAEKKPNWLPLLVAAGAAWVFLA